MFLLQSISHLSEPLPLMLHLAVHLHQKEVSTTFHNLALDLQTLLNNFLFLNNRQNTIQFHNQILTLLRSQYSQYFLQFVNITRNMSFLNILHDHITKTLTYHLICLKTNFSQNR